MGLRTISNSRLVEWEKLDNAPADINTSLAWKEDTTNKWIVWWYASLDWTGKVPAAQLPSYVDDVQEYADLASFPETWETWIIYIALDTNLTYRWSWSTYVEIFWGVWVWQWAYNGSTSYVLDDRVSYEWSSYICTAPTTWNLPTDDSYWDLLAQKWDTGDTWDTWAKGDTWDTGATWDTWAQWDQWIQGEQWDKWDTWDTWAAWADWLDVNWLWAYAPATAYVINDSVSYNGSSYICILGSTWNLPTNATYWDLMASKWDTWGVDWEQIYYLWKNWNDSNDWLTVDKAFLTFWAAITEATAQSPTSTNSFVIYCNDRGIYTEDVVLPSWVDIKATSAFIDWSLTVVDNQSVRICTVDKIIKSSWTWQSYVDACRIKTPDTETWVLNSSTWSLIMKARRIDAPLNWIGINNTSTWHIHCDVNHLVLEWNNAIWVQSNWGDIIGSIEAIGEEWTPTTTTALKVVTWHIDTHSSEIIADTAYNVAAGYILTLQVGHLEGTKTVADWWDAQISEASKSTDELAATWVVNGSLAVSLNADISKLDIEVGSYYIQGTKYVYAWGTAVSPTIGAWDSSTWVWFDSSWIVYSWTKWTSAQTQTILPAARLQAVQWDSGPWSDLQSPIDERYIISEPWYLERLWHTEAIWVLYNTWGTYSESSTALQVDQSAWKFYDAQRKAQDITADTNIEASALYHVSWSWSLQTRATLVTPLYYDNQTDIVALPVNKWATHTLLRSPKEEDLFFLLYSQAAYDSQADAEAAGVDYWLFVNQSSSWLVAVASIIIKGSSTNIDAIVDRRPFAWGNNPWVVWTATMQQSYDNSSDPEILTDAIRWAVTVKRWSAADTDCIFEWLNWAWSQTFCVDWNWDVTASWDITWDNLSWDNTWDETTTTMWTLINWADAKTTPVDTDLVPIRDVTGWLLEKVTWANIKATLKTYFDSATSTFTNKTFDANWTWNSLSNVDVADLADGTDWELITWDASWNPDTVAVWTADQVLTSNWVWEAPTFQDAWGGGVSEIFDVYGSNYTLTTTDALIPLDTEVLDEWWNYNNSTYRYTAPSDWNYQFSYNFRMNWVTAWNLTYVTFKKNWNLYKYHIEAAWTVIYSHSWTFIVPLVETDYIEVFVRNSTAANWTVTMTSTQSWFNWYKLS